MAAMTSSNSTARTNRPRIVADVDTGIDDMLALIYLAKRHLAGEIELVAVTCTAGNTTVCQAARNSQWILDLCGASDIPVAAGYGAPLSVPLTTTPETHGEFGLGFARPPSAGLGSCDAVGAAPGVWKNSLPDASLPTPHLLITGPLTTAARHLDLASEFSGVTVMGGAVNYPGNTTPTAEWNFWVDPDAVKAVVDSDLQFTLCSLKVTEQVTVDPTDVEAWAIPGELGEVVEQALRFYFGFHRSQGEGYLAQVHDLYAAMVASGGVGDVGKRSRLVRLESVEGARGTVQVAEVAEGEVSRGTNVRLIEDVDPAEVHEELRRVLAL